jgi:hopanoid biosynthesis associated protein HpnK
MSKNVKRVIVHADDFGLTEKTNEGIVQAHRHGILTSASIMANGEAFEHAATLARATPTLDVGIHLTLIEERPLLRPSELPTLVDSDGRFHRHAIQFVKRYAVGKIGSGEIEKELEAQIEKVLAAGIMPSHLDSHQHVHILPGILKIVSALSRKYDIPAIRVPREVAVFRKIGGVPVARIIQALVLNFICEMANGRIERRTDAFAGFLFGGKLHKENLQKVLRHLPRYGTCEIMCHPGLEDPADSRYAHWQYQWLEELRALSDPEIGELARSAGIQLISYRELGSSSNAK